MSQKIALEAQLSSASIFYEQIKQDYQLYEMAELARLERLIGGTGSKPEASMNNAVQQTEKIRDWTEHVIGVEALADKLDTKLKVPGQADLFGLSEKEAAERLRINGPNQLTEKKGLPWYIRFLLCMTGLFNYLLWAGAILCFIAYGIQEDKRDASNLYLGIVLAFVVFAIAVFSYSQQSKSAALMAQFKNYMPPKATVYREGKKKEINSAAIVVGDIVEINNGSNIPADIVLIRCNEMKVNNASLTGESEDILRIVDEHHKSIFESPNVAFFGTFCTNGEGAGIVIKTGDNTVIGQIANLAQNAEELQTPLSIEIEKFIKFISIFAVSWGLFFFLIGFLYGYTFITNLVFMIGIIVANVPEGLLMTITLSLALTAKKMAEKYVLVKNMESVETLGSTSCICSDKTGTLTQNKMTVSHMFFNLSMKDASVNYEQFKKNPTLGLDYDIKDPTFQALVQAISLGTKAQFRYTPSKEEIVKYVAKKNKISEKDIHFDQLSEEDIKEANMALQAAEQLLPIQSRKTEGDASEASLVKFVEPLIQLEKYRAKYPVFSFPIGENKLVESQIPFSSEIKFNMLVRDMNKDVKHPKNASEGLMLVMKGAPERILNRCSKILINGEEQPFDARARKEVNDANDQLGRLGERVLAFAKYDLEPDIYTKTPGYEFDVKNWKSWSSVKERDPSIKGWFPMYNLTLIGLVSLNDPPRVGVDLAVEKCRHAGIKVIMVTGDQPPTAAAIAHKVNIITKPELEYFTLIEQGHNKEDAWEKAHAIVIHGDLLAEKHANEDNIDDRDPEKGRFLTQWISKPEVVFARTTPSQKLLIVNACQRAGYIVAVTGDGVNDSPAIKQADIGIAMGSGSDVAKNAADMILLDDNFCSIVNGVEQGRVVFDDLKKSITYTMTSNIPELTPFLTFIMIQCPLPLVTILILCIDLGTDIAPAVAFAYEEPELDIMERMPRNARYDSLVTPKVVGHAYLTNGFVQSFGAFVTWCYVLNDYGIRPTSTLFLALEIGYYPLNSDIYNPDYPNFGNSMFGKEDNKASLFWDGLTDNELDIRIFYVHRNRNTWTKCRWDPNDLSIPQFWRISDVSRKQICYTVEANKYAQGAFLISIVCGQIANLIICKTRSLSISQQGFYNHMASYAVASEVILILLISYIRPLQVGLGTRAVASPHFMVPTFTYYMLFIVWDEARRIFVRSGTDNSLPGRIRYTNWVARNTFW